MVFTGKDSGSMSKLADFSAKVGKIATKRAAINLSMSSEHDDTVNSFSKVHKNNLKLLPQDLEQRSKGHRGNMRSSKRGTKEDDIGAQDLMLDEIGDIDDVDDDDIDIDKDSEGKLKEDEKAGSENVKVMVRCRPILKHESSKDIPNQLSSSSIQVHSLEKCIEIEERRFYFDQVFGPNVNNEFVYMKSARQLVESAFKGFNCTIFLYGQTGTGKTYTHSSLTLNSFAHLFSLIQDSNKQAQFLIRASYYELYNEDIRDLLIKDNSNKTLELRESKERGVYIKDLSSYLVNNLTELEKLKRVGDKHRVTASTDMNEHSSRSHSIFSITIEAVDSGTQIDRAQVRPTSKSSTKSSRGSANEKRAQPNTTNIRMGRLNLIDLAGSERQSKSGSHGARLKEASRINLSLTCLSLVIRALTDSKSTHIPYRNSKLTRLLSSSLGGNSKTLLIACISPEVTNLEETLNTLRFAQRTKLIKNEVRLNEDPKDALLRKYRQQIEELRLKLQKHKINGMDKPGTSDEDKAVIEYLSRENGFKNDNSDKKGLDSAERDTLLQQLRLLRSKIVVGGVNLLEKAELHERLLAASREELEEKKRAELELRGKLNKKKELVERMNISKESLENQINLLDEKLKRVLMMYNKTKEEEKDLSKEHRELKDSLLQSIRATSNEIKFADSIIEDFIPGKC